MGSCSAICCSRGSLSIASFSDIGLPGGLGISLAMRSTRPSGICSTRPASRTAARACSEPSAMIWADPVGAIFVAHIAHHLVAPLLAEIDVEVRHRDAFGIEEALEEQAEAHGIEIGDVQRPGHQRGGAGAAHADRNALRRASIS